MRGTHYNYFNNTPVAVVLDNLTSALNESKEWFLLAQERAPRLADTIGQDEYLAWIENLAWPMPWQKFCELVDAKLDEVAPLPISQITDAIPAEQRDDLRRELEAIQ